MALVDTFGADQPVNEVGQLISTVLTIILAAVAIGYCLTIWRRDRTTWQFFLLLSGGLTCLMEPLYDHLYGLGFFEEGQWHLYTTFGSHQPVWVPAAYVAFYGGASVFVARSMAKRLTMRNVWVLYGAGILYLSVRHGVENPPMWLVHLAAVTVVGGIAVTVRTLGRVTTEGAAYDPA